MQRQIDIGKILFFLKKPLTLKKLIDDFYFSWHLNHLTYNFEERKS